MNAAPLPALIAVALLLGACATAPATKAPPLARVALKGAADFSDLAIRSGVSTWAAKLGAPYIHFARPGTHGSSGDHMQRRRRGESELITLALDQLKTRYAISEWVLVGQSGGGHVTASLLVHRNDIVCAVPASSVSSPRMRWILRGWATDATGYHD